MKVAGIAAIVVSVAAMGWGSIGCSSPGKASDGGRSGAGRQEQTVTLTVDAFTLAPGSQGFKCQTFANPLGRDLSIVGWEFNSGSSSAHHLLVFPEENAQNSPLADCQMRAEQDIILGSQSHWESVHFPVGVATPVAASRGLVLRFHYLNRKSTSEQVEGPTLKLKLAPAGAVRSRTGVYSFTNTHINVAAGQTGSATLTVTVPYDMQLVWSVSHMHDHGVSLIGKVGDKVIYTSRSADNPRTKVFDTPLAVRAGAKITFACTFRASPDYDLHYGLSLSTNEMCNMKGGYIRADGQTPKPFVPEPGFGSRVGSS